MNSPEILETLEKIEDQIYGLLPDSTPKSHETFFAKFGISNETRARFFRDNVALSRNTFERTPAICGASLHDPSIPDLIHRLWLTDPTAPAEPPELYLRRIKRQ